MNLPALVLAGMLIVFVLGFCLGRMERNENRPQPMEIEQPQEFTPTLKADVQEIREQVDRRKANLRPRGPGGRFLKKPLA